MIRLLVTIHRSINAMPLTDSGTSKAFIFCLIRVLSSWLVYIETKLQLKFQLQPSHSPAPPSLGRLEYLRYMLLYVFGDIKLMRFYA